MTEKTTTATIRPRVAPFQMRRSVSEADAGMSACADVPVL